MAWIPNDPTKSFLPKPLNPSYLHIKTCLSVVIAPNYRSGKKPIISRLCFCVCWQMQSMSNFRESVIQNTTGKQTLQLYVFILRDNCYIGSFKQITLHTSNFRPIANTLLSVWVRLLCEGKQLQQQQPNLFYLQMVLAGKRQCCLTACSLSMLHAF